MATIKNGPDGCGKERDLNHITITIRAIGPPITLLRESSSCGRTVISSDEVLKACKHPSVMPVEHSVLNGDGIPRRTTMILHEPFIIGPNLRPALKVGNGTLSLASMSWVEEPSPVLGKRMAFGFYLDTPDFEYFDARVQSGCGGCGLVEAFKTFLCFLEAAGENTDLFPLHVVEWAAAQTYLGEARSGICDEDGNVLHHLIKE